MYGPTLPISQEIDAQKYRTEGESFEEKCNRIAEALKDSDEHYHQLRDILLNQRFLPAGRVQAAMGAPRKVTAYNCFVSETMEDSFDGIMRAAWNAGKTMRMGGGIGYDFSVLRPRGDLIVSLDSRASGPISFMEIFDAICKTIASAGHRRGAQMGALRVDHPDIEEFVHAKQNTHKLTGFNISVAVTDEFMRAVENGSEFDLKWGGRIYKRIDARKLWEEIMRSTYDWAEPGVIFIDRINEMNNLRYCETIAATNPCGEQPLPPYGACLLGSFNLTKYLVRHEKFNSFDMQQFIRDVPVIVRAMDNVIDRTIYPLPEQEAEAKAKRRMGLGFTGVANAGEILGFTYGSGDFINWLDHLFSSLVHAAYLASVDLAKEKGAFPLFNAEDYCNSKYLNMLSSNVRDKIREHGIRNSHLISIAPTGTISLSADNVSSGIEPVFTYTFERTIQTFDGPKKEVVSDYAFREFGVRGRTADECTPMEHLLVLACASHWSDSAVSKTINVPKDINWEDFKNIYYQAWKLNCKGVTTYRKGGKREGIFNEVDEGQACYIDSVTGQKTCG